MTKRQMKKKCLSYALAAVLTANIIPSQLVFGNVNYFKDDFENGISNWDIQKGNWDVKSDISKVFIHNNKSIEGRASAGDYSLHNYYVEADIKVTDFNGSNRAFLCGRYLDGNNYYGVSLSSKNDGIVELRKKVYGTSSVIAKANESIKANQWYKVKLEMNGLEIKVYLNGNLIIEAKDDSLNNGAVGLVTNKVAAMYDNVVIGKIGEEDITVPEIKPSENPMGPEISPEAPSEIPDEPVKRPGDITNESNVDLAKYSVEGFAEKVTGGGIIDEASQYYVKVTNAAQLGQALKRKTEIKVIEIMNDIDLGWNEIGSNAQIAPFSKHNAALIHPILIKSGISKITVQDVKGLTIYSKNGAKLTHGGFTFKNCENIAIRNIKMDELWEWDEATKGDYDKNDWDYITLEGCQDIWIDHCTFGKAYDGIVDSKKGTTGLTISYSNFLPGDLDSEFYQSIFTEMEQNKTKYPMYSFLREQCLSKNEIMKVASPQKKTHLIGATELAADNSDLELTLHHNYYKDSQDRMPRLRGGNAHIYNIVMDSTNSYSYRDIISSTAAKNIKNAGYHFGITSNGALSTEGGALLIEKSVILDVASPLRNNQKSVNKTQYTGKALALDIIYTLKGVEFRGNSTDINSPLSPEPAQALDFTWNKFNYLPYSYSLDEPEVLIESLKSETGCSKLILDTEQWLITKY